MNFHKVLLTSGTLTKFVGTVWACRSIRTRERERERPRRVSSSPPWSAPRLLRERLLARDKLATQEY